MNGFNEVTLRTPSAILWVANLIKAMLKCPKFIICRIQGKAVGGGVFGSSNGLLHRYQLRL
ncbi:MAG: hypothetical protein IPJ74_15095 [Saprospiraceae bacterium]|nr:hypothetical protein [Saprospiraceae bacterium]